MLKRYTLGLLGLVGFTFAIFSVFSPETEETHPQTEFDFLTERFQDQQIDLETRQRVLRRLNSLKSEGQKERRGEDPGAFIEALAQVKTGPDGQRYSFGYQLVEKRKASDIRARRGLKTKSLPWQSRGPGNMSGRARAIAIDPVDASGNTWFLPTVGGGVWKTTDAGDTWNLITPESEALSTTSIAISPSNPDVMYVGTGMGYGRVVDLEGSGVWKSIDHGETWFQLASTANGELLEAINRIIVHPEDENIVLLCSNNSFTYIGPNGGDKKSGIFKSIDGGESWTQVFDPDLELGATRDNRVQQIIADPTDFNIMYASVNEVGVVKSTDMGESWTISADNFALSQDIGQSLFTYRGISTRTELAIAPSDPSRIYASVERPFTSSVLYMSKDAGANWSLVSNVGQELNWHSSSGNFGQGVYTSGWFNNTITVNPFDENEVFVGGVSLFRIQVNPEQSTRTIAAMAWWFSPNIFGVPSIHGDTHLLTTIPDPDGQNFRILTPNDGGVAISYDAGNNWVQKVGMISSQFYGVDKKPNSDVYIAGSQDNGTWMSGEDPDEGSTWTHVIGGDGFETVWNSEDDNLVMGTSQGGRVKRSENGGLFWTSVPEATGSGGPFISKLAQIKNDPNLVFTVTFNGVNRSDDFGLSWEEIGLSPWIGYRPFSQVKISQANSQVIWAASRRTPDVFNNIGGTHVSKDGGFSFEEVTENIPLDLVEASGLVTHPTSESTAYLLFSQPGQPKILKTNDYGESWEDISGFSNPVSRFSETGFPDVAVFTLVVMPFDSDILWAGTEIGLFVSEDGGQTWNIDDSGIPRVSIFDMKIVDNEVVLATYGRGIWTVELPELDDYELPVIVKAPRLLNLALVPTGGLNYETKLPSEYDSVHFILGDEIIDRIIGNEVNDESSVLIQTDEVGQFTGRVVAFKDGIEYLSPEKTITTFGTSPIDSYVTLIDEFETSLDFSGDFLVSNQPEFNSLAIHSAHPYPDATDLHYQLKYPITVADQEAIMRYRDVALIEPGVSTVFGESGFYDYVVVEGTSDGINWLPLADGYDSRFSTSWTDAYEQGIAGSDDLFLDHMIDLHDTFESGDVIFIRFRLSADPAVNGWGWAIDNVVVQDESVTAISNPFLDSQIKVYPNPAHSYVSLQSESLEFKSLTITGINGNQFLSQQVRSNNLTLDVSSLKPGVYFIQLETDAGLATKRFVKN